MQIPGFWTRPRPGNRVLRPHDLRARCYSGVHQAVDKGPSVGQIETRRAHHSVPFSERFWKEFERAATNVATPRSTHANPVRYARTN
jgi:hypothetical protein